MKKFTLFFVLLTLIITGTLYSQAAEADYKKIDYIHVDQDALSSFLKLAEANLKPSYQQLVDSKKLNDWALYYVEFPGGEKSKYNFVSIASASNLAAFRKLFSPVSAHSYIPEVAKDKKMLSVENAVLKSELWKVESTLSDSMDSNGKPSKYMSMDYMNVAPGKSPDYLMLENEIAKPIHVERVNQDIMAGWEVYSLITPGGIEYGYNFATANFYNKLKHLEYGFNNKVIMQAMGENANIPELFNTIYTTRDMVKSELWELVSATE